MNTLCVNQKSHAGEKLFFYLSKTEHRRVVMLWVERK